MVDVKGSFFNRTILLFLVLILTAVVVVATTLNFHGPNDNSNVSAEQTNIIVFQFNLTTGTDILINGTAPAPGDALTANNPWTNVHFYDVNTNWEIGSDWIGNDSDNDNNYTTSIDSLLDADGTDTLNEGTTSLSSGATLTQYVVGNDAGNVLCVDSLTIPTAIRLDTDDNCTNDAMTEGSYLYDEGTVFWEVVDTNINISINATTVTGEAAKGHSIEIIVNSVANESDNASDNSNISVSVTSKNITVTIYNDVNNSASGGYDDVATKLRTDVVTAINSDVSAAALITASEGTADAAGAVSNEPINANAVYTIANLEADGTFYYEGAAVYNLGEDLFLNAGATYSAGADFTIAGIAPAEGATITDVNPWVGSPKVKFNDVGVPGTWEVGSDWIGTSVDDFYLDDLIGFSIENEGTAVDTTDLIDVVLYQNNGTADCSGSLSTPLTWNLSRLVNDSISWNIISGTTSYTICANTTVGATNDATIQMRIPINGIDLASENLPAANLTSVGIITIDSVNPVIALDNDSSGTWVNSDVINVSVSDADSGVANTRYFISDNDTCDSTVDSLLDGGSAVVGTSVTANNETTYYNKYICFRVTDNVGNTNYVVSAQIAFLDTSAPSVNASNDVITNVSFTQESIVNASLSGVLSYSWVNVSGPGDVTFGNSSNGSTSVSVSVDGTYVLGLTVVDNAGNSNSDTMTLVWDTTVPNVYAGSDVITNVSFTQVSVVNDSLSGVLSYSWVNVSGPGDVTFGNSSNGSTSVNVSVDGTYVLGLTVVDNAGNSNSDTMTLVWDTQAVTISNIMPTIDAFICAIPTMKTNQNTTIRLTAIDSGAAGINWVKANISEIDPTSALIDLVSVGGGVWEFNLSVNDTSSYAFTNKIISFTASDNAGNSFIGQNSTLVILYNMTNPAMQDPTCETYGAGATNFCSITNFNYVNLTQEIMKNGSVECNVGTLNGLPWGDTMKKVISITFQNINLSDNSTTSALQQLGTAIRPSIAPPSSFDPSFIYVNATAISALNHTTIITMYGLPFSEEPIILGDDGESNITVSAPVINAPYELNSTYNCSDLPAGEQAGCIATCVGGVNGSDCELSMYVSNMDLTFTVPHFSQYDMTDSENPTVQFTTPSNSAFNNGSVNYAIRVNGTGTQVSNLTLLVDGVVNVSLNNQNIFIGCDNLTQDWDVVTCSGTLTFATEGSKNLTAIAFDYGSGNSPGNTNITTVIITVDMTNPTTNATNPGSSWTRIPYNITLEPSDAPSGINYTTYVYNGTTANGTSIYVNISGIHNITYYSVDNVGNIGTTNSLIAYLDTIAPTTTEDYSGSGWQIGTVIVNLTPTDALTGVAVTRYNYTGAPTMQNGTQVTLDTTGNYTVQYFSTDVIGNNETINTLNVLIDNAAPTSIVTGWLANGTAFTFDEWVDVASPLNITFNFTGTDVNSGYNKTWYCNDTANECTPSTLYNSSTNVTLLINSGTTYIRYKSSDNVGNNETIQSNRIMIVAADATLLEDNGTTSTVTLNSTVTVITVPNNNSEAIVTIPVDVDATLDLSLNLSSNESTLSGSINTTTSTSSGITVTVDFPANLTITGNSSWEGIVNLPTVKADSSVDIDADSGKVATAALVIELGADDVSLTFDKGVRLKFVGQAGEYVGFQRGTTFTQITDVCDADTQVVGNALAAGADCKIDVDDDLIIWTKHFTKFVTYAQENEASSGGSSSNHNYTVPCTEWSVCVAGEQTRSCTGLLSTYAQTRTCSIASSETTTAVVTDSTTPVDSTASVTTNTAVGTNTNNEQVEPVVNTAEDEASTKTKSKNGWSWFVGIVLVLAIAIVIIVEANHKKNNK
ncbi:MAG: hypothetical protein WC758_01920 [Candidatus Woesearchaeota archaeon]|jgi:hypothetical protein